MERIRCGMCIDSKKIWHRLVCDKYDCKRVCLWQFWRKFDRSNTFRPIDDTIRTVDDEFRSIDKIRCIVNLIWARAESRMAKNWPGKSFSTYSNFIKSFDLGFIAPRTASRHLVAAAASTALKRYESPVVTWVKLK